MLLLVVQAMAVVVLVLVPVVMLMVTVVVVPVRVWSRMVCLAIRITAHLAQLFVFTERVNL